MHGQAATVILEAGLRTRGDTGARSRRPAGDGVGRVSKLTRVCEYDRPGTITVDRALSRSDPIAMPERRRRRLTTCWRRSGRCTMRGPIVLVGHSMDGLIVRLYAAPIPAGLPGWSRSTRWPSASAPADAPTGPPSMRRYSGPLPARELRARGDRLRTPASRQHAIAPSGELARRRDAPDRDLEGIAIRTPRSSVREFERDVERAWDGSSDWLAAADRRRSALDRARMWALRDARPAADRDARRSGGSMLEARR